MPLFVPIIGLAVAIICIVATVLTIGKDSGIPVIAGGFSQAILLILSIFLIYGILSPSP